MDPVEVTDEDLASIDSINQPETGTGSTDTTKEQEGFFNLLTHVQGARIDEQRCNIQIVHSGGAQDGKDSSPVTPPPEMNLLMDMLAQSQSRRLDDQRADFTHSPGFPDTIQGPHDNGSLKVNY
ncbi:hypothetical protein FKM82_007488 [Ascaphus truei]